MNSKLANLIAIRFNDVEREGAATALTRYLVSSVFPLISRAAHLGIQFINIPGFVNDDVAEALEELEYVVRREGLFTSIEWGPQNIVDERGVPKRVSCEKYIDMKRAFKARQLIPAADHSEAYPGG